MIKGFIFDMDGTVIDSTENDYKAWERAMKEKGITFPYADFIALLGAKGEEIVAKYLTISADEIKELLKKKEDYFMEYASLQGIRPISGVIAFLDKVQTHHIPAALATGAGNSKLDFIFERIDIRKYFKVILTANDTKNGKPNPEIFLKAAEKLGVEVSEALVVEDSVNGVRAAKNAGIRCLAITSTNTRENLESADFVIDSYDQFDWGLTGV